MMRAMMVDGESRETGWVVQILVYEGHTKVRLPGTRTLPKGFYAYSSVLCP